MLEISTSQPIIFSNEKRGDYDKIVLLEQPGTLKDFISEKEMNEISSLKITGKIGWEDFDGILYDMCSTEGFYYNPEDEIFIPIIDESPALRLLDLGEAEYVGCPILPLFGFHTLIESIIFPQGVESVAGDDGTSFEDSEWLKKVVFPEGIIDLDGFCNCINLENFVIPKSVERIANWAFCGCESLTEVFLPANVREMDGSSFGHTNVEGFMIDKNNPYLTVVDGVVYSKDLTELIAFPPAYPSDHFTVPPTTRKIGKFAFTGAHIKSIDLPDSLEEIGDEAFRSSLLESISIPKSVKKMGDFVFNYCYNLKHEDLPAHLKP